jgi:HEAT repeat protein
LIHGTLALGFHADARGLPAVRKVLKKYAHPQVRESAAYALVLMLRNKAVPELVEILKESGTLHERAAAAMALGLLPRPPEKAVDALKEIWRDETNNGQLRAAAIIALGAIGDVRTLPLSTRLIRHYNYFIRCAALDEIATLL